MADEDAQGQNSITVFIMGFFYLKTVFTWILLALVLVLLPKFHMKTGHTRSVRPFHFFSVTTVLLWIALPDEGQAKRR